MTPLPDAANQAGEQHRGWQRSKKPGEPIDDLLERCGGFRVRQRHAGEGLPAPSRIGRRERRDMAAGLKNAEQRQDRHEHRDGKRQLAIATIPGPHPQPEMQPDHRVAPGDDQHGQLDQTQGGRADEIDPQDKAVIVDARAEEVVRDADVDDMPQKQQRDREAEHQLGEFRCA